MFKTKSYFGVLIVLFLSIFVFDSTFAATATLSTSGTVSIDVSAAGNSANIGTDTLTVNTDCSAGYTVTIQSSISDASLYKDGDSTSTSKIAPSTGTISAPASILGNNLGTWGYSMTSSAVTGTFTGLNSIPAIIKQSTTASASGGDQFPVYYGVSVTPTLEPGAYTMANDPNNGNTPATIVYQLTMPVSCQTYTIKYNGNNNDAGTTMSVVNDNLSLNDTTTLMPSNFKRAGYGFAGWNTKADGTGTDFGPMEDVTLSTTDTKGNALLQAADASNEITLYAKWIQSQGNIQGWTGCSAMTAGDVTALTDTRDNNVYAIAKLADGNCWMIENMRLGGTSPMTLTPANTNITSDFTLSAGSKASTWCTDLNATCIDRSMLNTESTTNPVANMTDSLNQVVYSDGHLYDWYSAVAGTRSFNDGEGNATGSICPAGWKLPTGWIWGSTTDYGDFYRMVSAISGKTLDIANGERSWEYSNPDFPAVLAALKSYPNNFIDTVGIYNSAIIRRGFYSGYWSSTALYSDYARGLSFSSDSVIPAVDRSSAKYDGHTVRCMADKTASPGKIMYHDNGAESPTTMSEQAVSRTTATLWPSNFKHTGGDYGFAGWNTKKDGTGTSYGPMEDITLPSDFATNGLNLYAMWIPSAGNIQNWNGCSSLATSAVTALKDTRDGNTYAIAKLADGKCWMIENLRLGGTSPITLTPADSNVTSSFTLSATTDPTTTAWCTTYDSACYDQSILSSNNTTNPISNMTSATLNTNDSTGIYSYGNYYNWYSATAGTGTYSTSTNNTSVASSVCPAGWHLPKGGNKSNEANNEYWNLIVTKLNNGTNPANYSSKTSPYFDGDPEGTDASKLVRKYPNNFLYSGYVDGSSLYLQGSRGYVWSSTASSSTYVYYLNFYSASVVPGTFINGKYGGLTVRCVQ